MELFAPKVSHFVGIPFKEFPPKIRSTPQREQGAMFSRTLSSPMDRAKLTLINHNNDKLAKTTAARSQTTISRLSTPLTLFTPTACR